MNYACTLCSVPGKLDPFSTLGKCHCTAAAPLTVALKKLLLGAVCPRCGQGQTPSPCPNLARTPLISSPNHPSRSPAISMSHREGSPQVQQRHVGRELYGHDLVNMRTYFVLHCLDSRRHKIFNIYLSCSCFNVNICLFG